MTTDKKFKVRIILESKKHKEKAVFYCINKMNTLGLSMILKMGCICTKEAVNINGTRYVVKERLGEGLVIIICNILKSLLNKTLF